MNTARLALPLLAAGQAQKEMTHNEALATLDIAVQASVAAVGVNGPPAAPLEGDAWIVGAAPSGDWAGQAGAIASWTAGGWRFLAPAEGLAAWSRADSAVARYRAGGWEVGVVRGSRLVIGGNPVVGARQPAIADPGAGRTIDSEARQALGQILATLRAHGLIAS